MFYTRVEIIRKGYPEEVMLSSLQKDVSNEKEKKEILNTGGSK